MPSPALKREGKQTKSQTVEIIRVLVKMPWGMSAWWHARLPHGRIPKPQVLRYPFNHLPLNFVWNNHRYYSDSSILQSSRRWAADPQVRGQPFADFIHLLRNSVVSKSVVGLEHHIWKSSCLQCVSRFLTMFVENYIVSCIESKQDTK